ncbi:MAG: DUF1707 domain-containing protein [Mycobacterium sp.]|nr:DUF1707 domain-containing protein [Mycobacterium sp.]
MTEIENRFDTRAVVRYDGVPALRVSDADRNGTLRRLHNAVGQGLIDIGEFEERSAQVSMARQPADLESLVDDLPRSGAIASSSADHLELRGWMGSLERRGEWTVPTRLSLVRRMGSVDLDLTTARFAGPVVVIELDLIRGSLDLRLPEGASASIDDVTVYGGSARDRRKNPPAEGRPHVVLTGRVVLGSVTIRGPKRQVPSLPVLRRR